MRGTNNGERRTARQSRSQKTEKRKAESSSGGLTLCQTRKGGQHHPFGCRKEVVHSLPRACNAHCALRRTPSWGRLPGQVAACGARRSSLPSAGKARLTLYWSFEFAGRSCASGPCLIAAVTAP